jgi:hypothetical protein
MEEIAAAIPDDLAALRPEDIRVEAEFVDVVVKTAEPEAPVLPVPFEPVPVVPPVEPRQPTPPKNEAPPPPEPQPIILAEPQPPAAAIGGAFSGITIEPTTILPPGREIQPVHEVILQPATVLAWSLLVLLSLPMAFIAGLLIGHFVWK